MRVVVVGGGIGGLAAAVALGRAGHEVTVLERAARFGEDGSGLSLWPNALRALERLGVGAEVRRRSRAAKQPVIRDAAGRWLSHTDVRELERRFGPLLMIHRAELLDALHSAVSPSALWSGMEAGSATPDGSVTHSDGVLNADLVVGADGINSAVRESAYPRAAGPRYVGYSAYRMVTRATNVDVEGESWGRGQRFGYVPLPDGRVYCFAVVGGPSGAASEGLDGLRQRYRQWHAPIPELLDAVPADAVLHHDLYEMPPLPSYVSGRIALLGDAAHAMTPDLGQGAGQAIEDALVLGALLHAHPTVRTALAAYDRCRRPHTQAVTRRSRRVGSVAQWRSAPAVAVRDQLVRVTPDRLVLRSLAPVLGWQPPSPDLTPAGEGNRLRG